MKTPAEKSGLFDSPTPQKQPIVEKPQQKAEKPQKGAAKPRTASKPSPAIAKNTDSDQQTPPTTTAPTTLDLADHQAVFCAIRDAHDNPAKFNLATKISLEFKRCSKVRKGLSGNVARAEALTIPELTELLTSAIRSDEATPTDINKSLQTMREINPALFADVAKIQPDPCAVFDVVTSWAGMSGAEIAQSVGGADALSRHLSKVLKCDVVINVA